MARDVRWYLTGLTFSMLGDAAMSLVAGIWVKQLTGSSRDAGLVSVCVFAPSLLAPVAGVLADRYRRRSVLQVANLSAGVVVLALLLVHGVGQLWLIFAVMLWYGATLVVIDPAETAMFAELVPAEQRGALNGVRLTLQEGGKLIAPLAGAGLFAVAGGGVVAALDAATFAVAFGAITSMRFRDAPPVRTPSRWRSEIASGFSYIRGSPGLPAVVGAGALAMFVSGVGVAAQYSLVDALHRPPAFLGVLVSILGAGSIVAGLAAGRLLRRLSERTLVLLGLANLAAGTLMAAAGWLPVVLASYLVRGFALPWIVVAVITATQRPTPNELQGRVAAAVTLVLFAPQPIAQAAGALLINSLDYRTIYLVTAMAGLATMITLRPSRARGVPKVDG